MPIHNRDLPAGTKLAARYKGEVCEAEVVETDDGIRYRLASGEEFTSPSAAGSHVMHGISCNGWRFWHLADELPPARTSQEPSTQNTEKAKRYAEAKKKRTLLIRKIPNQKGLEEGTSRWWCSSCLASFIHDDTEEPGHCPQGHPREVSDELEGA